MEYTVRRGGRENTALPLFLPDEWSQWEPHSTHTKTHQRNHANHRAAFVKERTEATARRHCFRFKCECRGSHRTLTLKTKRKDVTRTAVLLHAPARNRREKKHRVICTVHHESDRRSTSAHTLGNCQDTSNTAHEREDKNKTKKKEAGGVARRVERLRHNAHAHAQR
jgi:hypothetical protein